MHTTKLAQPDHPIHELLVKRWSPYGFSDQAVSDDDLRALFEAARWSASSYNEQPWSFIIATQADPAAHAKVLTCLVEGNQAWAKAAPVLVLGLTKLTFKLNGKPNAAAVHDLGLATASLTFQATALGISVHPMIGILPDRVREIYQVPSDVQPLIGIAIGYVANPDRLPEKLRERDVAPRTRKPLAEFVYAGAWGTSSSLTK